MPSRHDSRRGGQSLGHLRLGAADLGCGDPFCSWRCLSPVPHPETSQRDATGRALTFATILAVLAAIPTPVTGTPVGFALLAWTGLGRLLAGHRPRRELTECSDGDQPNA